MSHIDKIKLLIWKNFLLQKRHKWQSFFEILCPVVFSLLLVLTRAVMEPKYNPDISYKAFAPTYLNMSHKFLGNLTDKSLAFSPESPLTRNVTTAAMERIARSNIKDNDPLGFFSIFFDSSLIPRAKGYKNAREMEIALTKPNAMNKYVVGIQFDDSMANATQWPDDITLALRFPAVMRTLVATHPLSASWRTNLLFPMFPTPGPREPHDRYGGSTPGYSQEMFLAVQHAVSQEIIKQKTGQAIPTEIYLQRLPQRAYIEDELLIILERFVSIILMISFIYTFVNTVKMVVTEKELQLKETMMIMGMPSWLHWLAWFIKQFSFLLVSIIIMTILFKVPFKMTAEGVGFAVFTFTPWSVVLFFLVLFLMSSLTFSFMVSAFFSRANTAASFMGLALIFSYSGYMLTQMIYEDISLTTKLFLSLISNTAMGFAFQMMVISESSSKGLQWGNFLEPVSYNDQFVPAHVTIMLIIDTILYMLVAMYVEKIRPGLYGVPLPWYFPFTKSFWLPNLDKTSLSEKSEVSLEYNSLLNVVHDEEPNEGKPGVNIYNLTKIYKGRKKAVDNLNLRMYENEITVLLGHNGAGKTTTMSMLTGMVPPSSGTATINGYDIVRETEQARQSLGLCPQHNVLFPDLTVGEHVVFYSRLKGVHPSKLAAEVEHFVKLLELEEKRDVVAAALSGGQKRRLSVGAAMCGASRVVLLDEPTSGLDPAARRALWDLLQREKRGRTVLLSTHFMDEADVLGDRVAIMAGGRLQCVGTPYFLKKHYGIGYKLTIVKGDRCNVHHVTAFFNSHVPDVRTNTNIGKELSFILPNENVSKFPQMLKELEERRESLHISSYGLTVTSLEDVFMKAGMENNNDIEENVPEEKTNFTNVHYNGTVANVEEQCDDSIESEEKDVQGVKLFMNRIKAMFLKLFYNTMRSKFISFIQLIAPIISLTLSVIVARSWRFVSELPALPLSLESGFKKTETIISHSNQLIENSNLTKIMTAYKDYFKSSTYPGMTVTDIGTMDLGKFYLKLSAAELSRVRYEALAGVTFNLERMTAWFSNYGYHDSAISLALANNALLRALAPNASLAVTNHPLPYSIENLVTLVSNGGTMIFQFSFNMGFCLGFVTSFLVLFVVKERVSGAKLLQRISGVRPAVMWGAALVWDWLWLQLIWLGILCAMACYQQDTMSTPAELGRIMLVLVVFSLAAIPAHYVVSFFFDDPPTGFCKMLFVNIFSGCIPFLFNGIMRLPSVGNEQYADIMDWVFAPLPIYSASRSFRQLSVTSFSMKVCVSLCDHLNLVNCTRLTICHDLDRPVCCLEDNPYLRWEAPGIGRYLFMMILVGVICFSLLLVKEYEFLDMVLYRAKVPTPEVASLVQDSDDDVATERREVESLTAEQTAQRSFVCKDLTKYYGELCAVDRVSFSVHRGECFGLLGINGAGKTSTFRMVAGDARVTAGDALVHGASVRARVRDVHRLIGYCPQFDALFDNLTARETLRIFCLLRGIPSRVGAVRARRLAAALGFTAHFDKKVHECSGGTRRKLSAAVALLGDAPLVLLDEPTTGMDPASKRRVWAAVSAGAARGRSVLLTSHSMEECEALCSRLTVMARGRLHCLGAPQHLKAKFSQGYTLVVKCKAGPQREDAVAAVGRYVAEQFSGARRIESYLGISTYFVRDAVPWWRVFQVLEAARALFPIEDYSVSQTTLEQVFLGLTGYKKI